MNGTSSNSSRDSSLYSWRGPSWYHETTQCLPSPRKLLDESSPSHGHQATLSNRTVLAGHHVALMQEDSDKPPQAGPPTPLKRFHSLDELVPHHSSTLQGADKAKSVNEVYVRM
ncbi:hypothetical protein E2C01_034560 [Portunus trituberculatus]|uniref:Uncharacterized protein n=1 Tax=Portunus trituberculatus TaxID=210409 RepID=A0A5B7F1W5_PORTR|nr:hypothetical protein [Portunus trituberculatus]